MAVYNKNGTELLSVYDKDGNSLTHAYDAIGNVIFGSDEPYVYGTSYAFSDMTMTDESGITELSALHTRNADSTIKCNPQVSGDVRTTDAEREWVVFDCNIPSNGQMVGLWIYVPVDSLPCYGGKTKYSEGLSRLKIKLNTSTGSWVNVRPGMAYYMFTSPPETITSISVSALNVTGATRFESCIYLDSVEVGFHAKRAHVMFNLDCSPANFMSVGYPLFEEFGLKCTLQYHISDTVSTPGAVSPQYDATSHDLLMSNGYDYATYSGWKNYEIAGTPFYDNDERRALFEAHAERMWTVNNDVGIYAPSCVHGTGFLWGYEYNNACRDYPFLMIRRGCDRNSNGVCQAYYDPEYRVMEPYFGEGWWTANSVSQVKSRIDYAIMTKQALQIGFHQIMPADYDTTQSGAEIYVNATAIRELLSYVKTKVDAGEIVCCTTSEYVAEMAPDTYAEWYTYRNPVVTP